MSWPSNADLRTNEAGLSIIKHWEGLGPEFRKSGRIVAYLCPSKRWTIGYGHTGDVRPGQEISLDEANTWLKEDVKRFEKAVKKYVSVPLNINQFSALVSLVYNIGQGNFKGSTLLRRLNSGRYQDVPGQFRVWRMGGVPLKILPGLVNRREDEVSLWLTQPNQTGIGR